MGSPEEVERIFQRDPADPDAAAREADLRGRFARTPANDAGVSLVSVACRTSMCRLELDYGGANPDRVFPIGTGSPLVQGSVRGTYFAPKRERAHGIFYRWHVEPPWAQSSTRTVGE